METNIGKVIQIIGPVVDIRFDTGKLPDLLDAVEIDYDGDLTMEASTYLRFPQTVIPEALRFTAESGKLFVSKFEEAKKQVK